MSTGKALPPVPAEFLQVVREFVDVWSQSLRSRRQPPGPLYHYCDANALVNIFKTRSLWATGTRYLNDTTELVSLLQNLPKTATKHEATPAGRVLVELSRVMQTWGAEIFANAIGAEIYVACFSEDGDMLSQWRSYADDGRGFAIGFDTRRLRALNAAGPDAGELRRIVYSGPDEQQLIDDLFGGLSLRIEPYLDTLDSTGWTYDSGSQTARTWLGVRLSECLAELSFESKHASFFEEREWRIIAPKSEIQFRASRGQVVPFRLLDVTSVDDDRLMPIERIVVGPKANWEDAERVLMYMADHYGYGHSGIVLAKSLAPYR